MRLSVIIPVLNGESFINESLARLHEFLQKHLTPFQIIVVNDGSSDRTADKLDQVCLENVLCIHLQSNLGKFAAIKRGMLEAKGACRIFTDADLPYELEALSYMEHLINERKFHIAIGDRALQGSEYQEFLSPWRRVSNLAFSHAVRLLVTGGLFDTQCGLKAFRADVANHLFPLLLDARFAADVELLYVALKYNLELRRIPVRLRRQGPSTVRSINDGLQMLHRLSLLRLNWSRGRYESTALRDIGKQYYWERREWSPDSSPLLSR